MMGERRRAVVTLMGPTASGKTQAALRIADQANVDIISVDSAMVYRRLDIGTAKPPPDVLARYPHALVDVVEPADAYSAARFVADADAAVYTSLAAGRTPLLVGGTMLYFRAFTCGLNDLPAADMPLRQTIAARAAAAGWPAVHEELARRDPAAAARIAPTNGPRIQRALEVQELTGRSITDHWAKTATPATQRLRCNVAEVAIVPPERAALHGALPIVSRRCCGMASWKKCEHFAPTRHCPLTRRPCARWAIAKYGGIWTATTTMRKWSLASKRLPAKWPNGSSLGCAVGMHWRLPMRIKLVRAS